jgi:tellurite resistance protein TerC
VSSSCTPLRAIVPLSNSNANLIFFGGKHIPRAVARFAATSYDTVLSTNAVLDCRLSVEDFFAVTSFALWQSLAAAAHATAVDPAAVLPAELAGQPTLWHWLAFAVLVTILLVLDLFVFHRDSHEPTLRESAKWTVVWCLMALAFNGYIWWWRGAGHAIDFLTGYLVEWSLSMDNVFVFAVIFSFFRVPLKYQYRVLFWGILGAVLMRLTFVLLGTALISRFDWVMPIFGAFLIYTAVKLAFSGDAEVDPEHNLLMRLGRKVFRVAKENHGNHFFARENGLLCVTPLFLVLLVIESTDVMFAVDSVPAIFGITEDPFIVFTSNIFAILGLRALYFLLAGVMDLFRYLNYGLSAVLGFVGVKMVLEYVGHQPWVPPFLAIKPHQHLFTPVQSLVIVLSCLGVSIVASVIAKRREDKLAERSLNSEP